MMEYLDVSWSNSIFLRNINIFIESDRRFYVLTWSLLYFWRKFLYSLWEDTLSFRTMIGCHFNSRNNIIQNTQLCYNSPLLFYRYKYINILSRSIVPYTYVYRYNLKWRSFYRYITIHIISCCYFCLIRYVVTLQTIDNMNNVKKLT